ncbi:2Fe-2S iron-sulfur cluster-binding protein, partial [Coxiella burnetii]
MNSKKSRIMTFSIMRFNPETDKKPYMQDFELDVSAIQGKMLLNALEALREKHPDIGLRRSCAEGVCGSDGMNINGKNAVACVTQLKDLPDRVVVRPLPGFPIFRDLIVDMVQVFAQLKNV